MREVAAALARRYEDVEAGDQLSRVQGKVDGVREQMQVNITRTYERRLASRWALWMAFGGLMIVRL